MQLSTVDEILNSNFNNVHPDHMKQALIEFYSKRNPLIQTFRLNPIQIKIHVQVTEKIVEKVYIDKKEKKITRDMATQTEVYISKYNYIFEIEDKRLRRSTAWKIYSKLCEDRNVTPQIRYPFGDDKDYIKLAEELENSVTN